MTVILDLPPELQEVPHDRLAWSVWRDRMRVHRMLTRQAADRDPVLQEFERTRCRRSRAYWWAMFGAIYEPRHRKTTLGESGGVMPAIPYAFQADVFDWFDARMAADPFQGREDHDGVVSKSRDSTFSWLFCAIATHDFIFAESSNPLLLSYKEDLVDSDDPKSLFWKILFLLGTNNFTPQAHPKWLTPQRFDPEHHHQRGLMTNPENGNVIVGDTTTRRSGRGGRNSWALLDEFAFVPNGDYVWNLLQSTTDHRFAISTENLYHGSHHRDLWQGLKADPATRASVLEFDWWMHPEHDQDWYDRVRRQAERAGTLAEFHAEIDRDPFTAKSDWYYPLARDLTERSDDNPNGQTGLFPYDPDGGDVACAIDPGAKDPTAILWFQHVPGTAFWNVIEAYDRDKLGVEYFGGVMNGELPSGRGLFPDDDALEVMQLTAKLRARGVTYYGDPDLAKKTFNDIDPALRKLARMGIHVNLATADGARNHPRRRQAMTALLPRLRWNTKGSERVKRALDAIQRSEYEHKSDNSTTESTRPRHNAHSHYRSAAEYFAVNQDRKDLTKGQTRDPYRMVNGKKTPVRSTYRPKALTAPTYHD